MKLYMVKTFYEYWLMGGGGSHSSNIEVFDNLAAAQAVYNTIGAIEYSDEWIVGKQIESAVFKDGKLISEEVIDSCLYR